MTEPLAVPTPALLRRPAPAAAAAPAAMDEAHGRVTDDGSVYLNAPEGEILVGQYAAGSPAEGLAFFQRKYQDMDVEISLISARLTDGKASVEQASVVLARIREQLAARGFVGDVVALNRKCDLLSDAIEVGREQAKAAKSEARARSLAARQALVSEAQRLSESTAWKSTNERYVVIVDEWKSLPRLDRGIEQELWKQISAARTEFDKRRRAHFATLDTERKASASVKRDLIAQAEALSSSTDWAGSGRKFRDLMDEWKKVPRGPKSDEDKLWKRFKAAQDVFFDAKAAADSAAEQELLVNLPEKTALVERAEGLIPVTDARKAKLALAEIQHAWDKAGDLPRADRDRLERRLRAVEEALRKAEQDSWKRSNPEARARAEATAARFAEAIAKLEQQRAAAAAKGDSGAADKLAEQIASTTALMDAAVNAAVEFSGR